jgi:sialate O-acetylesterase
MKPFLLSAVVTAAGFLLCPNALAVQFAGLFTDHMVLQRDQPVTIWGTADPGESITVTLAAQSKTTVADPDGRWSLKFDPLKAGGEPLTLTAKSAARDQQATVSDVLVGDVWLCSGQSNMHFQMKSVENAPQEIAGMNHPNVRFFTVKQQFGQQSLDDVEGTWQPVTPETAAACSAAACYFGTALNRQLGIPIGLVSSAVGGTRIESWMRPETLAATGESTELIGKWKNTTPEEFERIAKAYAAFQYQRDNAHTKAVREAREQGKPVPPPPVQPKLRCHDCPGALHHGMIRPLEPFRFRGVIWYQGESNAGHPKSYEKLLPAMIADWRGVWGAELPFLFVQIAPHRSIHPAFREAQHRIWKKTPHTAMVVTTDVGNMENIHPARKRPVGERLALAARATTYGEDIVSSGPVYQNMSIVGGRAVITFTHTGGGLVAKGDALSGFTIAGKDGKHVPATATIDGDTVVCIAGSVTSPVAVRYNWSMNPDGNLHNREGLPAAPFRTDPDERTTRP